MRKRISLILTLTILILFILFLSFITLWKGYSGAGLFFFVDHPRVGAQSFINEVLNLNSVSDIVISFLRSALSVLIGYQIEARVYYTLILLMIGINHFFFVKSLIKTVFAEIKDCNRLLLTSLIIALLAVFNPFVLGRLVLGHDRLLLVYSLIPWVFLILTKWSLEKGIQIKVLFRLILLSLIISIVSVHMIPALLILYFIWLAFNTGLLKSFLDEVKNHSRKKLFLYILILLFFSVLLLIEVYFSFFRVKSIGGEDVYTWATTSDRFYDIFLNTFSLNGLWLEKGLYLPTKNLLGELWILSFGITAFLGSTGFFILKGKTRKYSYFLMISLIVFGVLSMGINAKYDLLSLPYRVLFEMYILRGLREPQKLQMFISIIFIILSSVSIYKILNKSNLAGGVAILLSFIIISSISVGFFDYANNQIFQCEYPEILIKSTSEISSSETTLIYPHQDRSYYEFCNNRYTLNPFHNTVGSKHIYNNDLFDEDMNSREEIYKYSVNNSVTHIVIAKRSMEDFSYLKDLCEFYAEDSSIAYCKVK